MFLLRGGKGQKKSAARRKGLKWADGRRIPARRQSPPAGLPLLKEFNVPWDYSSSEKPVAVNGGFPDK
ncbi:MAG: hypothetical protein C6P37_12185 [Caldibacillus debilis]|jgi:hypothetical protein|uniref:Uncharacterized protein n=1 Tax=Caldibacillus debilis TaxID=301148 RepID=A0A3E0K265_9BACI|nr:hypothetical protein [Bacillaceae bacterium]OUM87703.1 MAG: hypothetical protein BAA03_08560 [Caldibacillus debilis]MBY6271199.1 hypothetical protein [Bacillaceae bacterium]REJ14345.1 MAG: hypothetical protein C6W57_14235 [Caldibacillus debilis]REJ27212.1 MAG: hypothetical protein C6P37_12185 [Caldibacillus debilis]